MRIADAHTSALTEHSVDLFDAAAPRKATNVTVNTDLLRQAREAGLNLSGLLEERLVEALRERRSEQWLAENGEGIADYNDRVRQTGVFSDGLRRF